MSVLSLAGETDPVRRDIIAAINRLLAGTPRRSRGLNISQLAAEADVKRWRLTHQHTDLKDRFQAEIAHAETQQAAIIRSADDYEDLKRKHTELNRHCRDLERRLEIYAVALNQLALQNAGLADRDADADAAKVRALPRRRQLNP
ncbi:hypothetical protein [Nocardia noduli]|uniref:hypothetical protein n=1 Tax=Nocardia noduli TaxID=2815722 RepID=UPI001C245B83|nr:hypothetical protein [Nocardia noduli]